MLKKILAFVMASVLALGVCAMAVSAEEETPAYTPVEYKIEDLAAKLADGEEVYLQPTDTIVLPASQASVIVSQEEATPAVSDVLIVEYLPGKDAASGNKMTRFVDYAGTGYAVLGIGGYPKFAYKESARNENFPIDYASDFGYAFKQWKVESVYSGKEINRIILSAEWAIPELHGWAGYKTMMKNYAKTFIDYVIDYFADLFTRIGAFFV